MALVNVGLELVRRGRRVLLVDFDLEAPGLSTYSALESSRRTRGLVEYVHTYLASGEVPDVRGFMYQVDPAVCLGHGGRGKTRLFAHPDHAPPGQLWVMPAGHADAEYGARLADINWQHLYQKQRGYLFFEDTKQQWANSFKFDYVLVDSRTGHSDIGGICTRQLADSVVLLFFPNDQNRIGLEDVCNEIRTESRVTGRPIGMHLVMSNVPQLDDEERILRRQRHLFSQALNLPDMSVIYRYESLMHLDQKAFVVERPRSRLARQYRRLTRKLILSNPRDREGALFRLSNLQQHADVLRDKFPHMEQPSLFFEVEERVARPIRKEDTVRSHVIADQLRQISEHFWTDPSVLFEVAKTYSDMSDYLSAVTVLDQVLRIEDTIEARLLRSRAKFQLNRRQDAVEDLLAGVNLPGAREPAVVEALRDLYRIERKQLHNDHIWTLIRRLSPDGKLRMVDMVATVDDRFEKAVELLSSAIAESRPNPHDPTLYHRQLAVYLLYRKEWERAWKILQGDYEYSVRRYKILTQFLKGMAAWGLTGEFPLALATEIVELRGKQSATSSYASDCQAMAIALWRAGAVDEAVELASRAMHMANRRTGHELSYWRCLNVPHKTFESDCRELLNMIHTREPIPAVLRAK
jgi:tetratricopeptide (TPR) repeat protein